MSRKSDMPAVQRARTLHCRFQAEYGTKSRGVTLQQMASAKITPQSQSRRRWKANSEAVTRNRIRMLMLPCVRSPAIGRRLSRIASALAQGGNGTMPDYT